MSGSTTPNDTAAETGAFPSLRGRLNELAALAVGHLRGEGKNAALAESCTGGLIAAVMASVPGASQALHSSAVVYQTESKTTLLGLDAAFVQRFGAVSEEVTRALAESARTKSGADIGLAVTGWAGPSGGSVRDPVGTCYIAVTNGTSTDCRRVVIPGDRACVRETAAALALDWLCRIS